MMFEYHKYITSLMDSSHLYERTSGQEKLIIKANNETDNKIVIEIAGDYLEVNYGPRFIGY